MGAIARVLALVPDLLLASRVEAALGAAGHSVHTADSPAEGELERADLVVCDLGEIDPAEVTGRRTPVLGFYSHVDAATRKGAERAGVDLVVPRSRMSRELPELARRLLAEAS